MSGRNQAAGLKLFVCVICQKSFIYKQSLKTHIRLVHENAGSFKCSYCDKTFQAEVHLKSHENFHTRERPFECEICNKRFHTKGNLGVHKNNIHEKRKFQCGQCNLAFGSEPVLKRHLVVHSVERPFECNECPQRFASERRLKLHHSVHDKEKFECKKCGKRLAKKASLYSHLCTKHREDREELDEQPEESNGSGGAKYSLRARSKPTNYREGQDLDESDESGNEDGNEPEESDEETDRKDEAVEDEQALDLDDPMEGSAKRPREPDSDGQTEDAQPNQENEMITWISDESDQETLGSENEDVLIYNGDDKTLSTDTSAIRSSKDEFDLALRPPRNGSPSKLKESINKAILESGKSFCIFGAVTNRDTLIIKFDDINDRAALVQLLVSSETISKNQIVEEEPAGNRFLLLNLPHELTRRDCNALTGNLVEHLKRTTSREPADADLGPEHLKVDIDDTYAILMVNSIVANYLAETPNLFVGLCHLIAVYYPPSPFCTQCCALDHLEEVCVNNAVCFQCAGLHAGGDCKPAVLCCTNCNHAKEKRTRHSAKSSLCKTKVARHLQSLGIAPKK